MSGILEYIFSGLCNHATRKILLSHVQAEESVLESLSDFPKVTKLISSRVKFQTWDCLPRLCFCWMLHTLFCRFVLPSAIPAWNILLAHLSVYDFWSFFTPDFICIFRKVSRNAPIHWFLPIFTSQLFLLLLWTSAFISGTFSVALALPIYCEWSFQCDTCPHSPLSHLYIWKTLGGKTIKI